MKRFSLYELSLWGRDFVSVVRIREGPYCRGYFYKECTGIFPRPSELSVLERCPYNREVSVRRGSTVRARQDKLEDKVKLRCS